MLIIKNELELVSSHDYWRKQVTKDYRIPLHMSREMNIPDDMINNTFLLLYIHKRLIRYHKVCYSDLWLFDIKKEDVDECDWRLGLKRI